METVLREAPASEEEWGPWSASEGNCLDPQRYYIKLVGGRLIGLVTLRPSSGALRPHELQLPVSGGLEVWRFEKWEEANCLAFAAHVEQHMSSGGVNIYNTGQQSTGEMATCFPASWPGWRGEAPPTSGASLGGALPPHTTFMEGPNTVEARRAEGGQILLRASIGHGKSPGEGDIAGWVVVDPGAGEGVHLGMKTRWELQFSTDGPNFKELIQTVEDVTWLTESVQTQNPTSVPAECWKDVVDVWHQDHTQLEYQLQMEDEEAALLSTWVRTGQWQQAVGFTELRTWRVPGIRGDVVD
eukprot:gene29348-36537_t